MPVRAAGLRTSTIGQRSRGLTALNRRRFVLTAHDATTEADGLRQLRAAGCIFRGNVRACSTEPHRNGSKRAEGVVDLTERVWPPLRWRIVERRSRTIGRRTIEDRYGSKRGTKATCWRTARDQPAATPPLATQRQPTSQTTGRSCGHLISQRRARDRPARSCDRCPRRMSPPRPCRC